VSGTLHTLSTAKRSKVFKIFFVRYALRHLPWTDRNNLPPYEERCQLITLETLTKRRTIACVLFIFDILTGKIDSPSLLASVFLNVSHYPLRTSEILRVDFHRTNYGMNEPLNNAQSKKIGIFLTSFSLSNKSTYLAYKISYRKISEINVKAAKIKILRLLFLLF
jgi:hypothetical protein